MASYVARMADEIEALAVYGTLAPGEKNHWVLSRIGGEWCTGTVRGYTFEITWGGGRGGNEGFVADESGGLVQVAVFCGRRSSPIWWREIDDFEGAGYERRSVEGHARQSGAVRGRSGLRRVDRQLASTRWRHQVVRSVDFGSGVDVCGGHSCKPITGR